MICSPRKSGQGARSHRHLDISLGFGHAATYMSSWSAPRGGDLSLHRGCPIIIQGVENIVVRYCVFRRVDENAVFLSRRTRNITIIRNTFEWLGESIIATWGETDFDGSADFPLGTVVECNVMWELGISTRSNLRVLGLESSPDHFS